MNAQLKPLPGEDAPADEVKPNESRAPSKREAAAESSAGAPMEDRGLPPINRARSVQARVTGLLSALVFGLLALGLLGWYYGHTATRQARTSSEAAASARSRASGESTVPPLGRVVQPAVVPPARTDGVARAEDTEQVDGSDEYDPSVEDEGRASGPVAERILRRPPDPGRDPDNQPAVESTSVRRAGSANAAGYGGAYAPAPYPTSYDPNAAPGAYGSATTPAQTEFARRLGGPAFAASLSSSSGAMSSAVAAAGVSPEELVAADGTGAAAPTAGVPTSGLASQLRPTDIDAVRARQLPSQHLLLPKGAFLDCTLETAIDSSLPGLTTCVLASPAFGADGRVVLLERGTKLIGETRSEAQRGGKRLFVLWNEARTPTGVVVELASPSTDPLGRSGLTGKLDRHFWERFGAATLMSVIDGAIQAGVAASRSDGGNSVVVSPTASSDVMTEVLKDTVGIPPSITVPQGTRLQVLVARDLDFRSVYALELHRAP